MRTEVIRTQHAPAPIGPYNQGVVVRGTLLFTAGQIPIIPSTGGIVQGDIKAQTAQVLENLKAILEASGSNLASVVKTTVYLRDLKEFDDMNEIYAQFFRESAPARTTVEVSRLPKDVGVEIDAVCLVVDR